ncbi:MAG: DMT family transporter [Sphaerochaetaceae bacterium]|nr:DMT family transporter [Sphaerochaetaceae bacterium]MDC7237476.1 DMT family transporter [Sphaerochaetaceae bacterium]
MSEKKILLYAICANLLWSTAFLFGKIVLVAFPPILLAGLRSIIASMMILIFIRRNPFKSIKKNLRFVLLLSLVNPFFGFTIYNIGLNYLPGSYVAMLKGSSPAFIVMVSTLLLKDEHMSLKNLLSLFLGILGVVLLSLSKNSSNAVVNNTFIIGIILLILSNFANAFASTMIKMRINIKQILDVNVIINLIGGILIIFVSLFSKEEVLVNKIDTKMIISLVYLSFITAGGSCLWNTIITHENVKLNDISIWNFLIPAMGAVLSWIFIDGDNPNIISVICLILVICSILISVLNFSKLTKLINKKNLKYE